MADICGDNRFELIEKYKQKLLDATNIEDSPEEMAVIDNILFRFWQMGWLKGEPFGISELLDCSDCVNNGGDWECDHVHCHKGTDTISRQALIDAYCAQCTVDKPETCSTIRYGDKWCNEVYMMQHMPTVDAVPVVRCKNCIHWGKFPVSTVLPQYHKCGMATYKSTKGDDFCSDGKDGDGNDNDMGLHV